MNVLYLQSKLNYNYNYILFIMLPWSRDGETIEPSCFLLTCLPNMLKVTVYTSTYFLPKNLGASFATWIWLEKFLKPSKLN